MIILKEVPDPERFGVAELAGDRIVGIEEKPARPKSAYAVTGIYFYDGRHLRGHPHAEAVGRGELEITDVNNAYIRKSRLFAEFFTGWWTDAGTFESLDRANALSRETAG